MAVGSRSRALSALLFVLFFVELAGLLLPAALHEAVGVVFVAGPSGMPAATAGTGAGGRTGARSSLVSSTPLRL